MDCRACQGSSLEHRPALGGREIVLGRAHAQPVPILSPRPRLGSECEMDCRACQGSRLKHELSLGGRGIVLGRAHAQPVPHSLAV